jgi:transposase
VLEQLVATNNDATLEELCDQLKQQADVLMSRSTVDRMLTKLNLTVKKTLHPTEKESERVQH